MNSLASSLCRTCSWSAIAFTCILALTPQSRASTFVSGNVSGTWTKTGSPYIATANVTVPSGQTLTIQPGVTVIIGQGLMIDVEGTISAIGTAAERIIIRGASPTLYWDTIQINYTGSTQSVFANCTISDGTRALYYRIDAAEVGNASMNSSVKNCIFKNCLHCRPTDRAQCLINLESSRF